MFVVLQDMGFQLPLRKVVDVNAKVISVTFCLGALSLKIFKII